MSFFSLNFPEVEVREEWGILPAEDRDYSVNESKDFWKRWQRLLTNLKVNLAEPNTGKPRSDCVVEPFHSLVCSYFS
jgi:hypothetical protein